MKNNFCKYVLIFCIIIEIPFLQRIDGISDIQTILQIVLSGVLLVKLLHGSKIARYNVILIGFLSLYVVSTALNSANLKGAIAESLHILSTSLFIEFGVKNNARMLAKGALWFFLIICSLNFLSLILYPEGLYSETNLQYTSNLHWILGYKNLHILYIMQLILWGGVYDILTNDKITKISISLILYSLIMAIAANSTTSIVGICILLAFEILLAIRPKTKIINILIFLIIYVLSFVSVIVFRIQERFDGAIYGLTGKHSDLVGRTYIWDSILDLIKRRLFLGYGKETALVRQSKMIRYQASHAHNEVLEIVYRTGLLGSVLLFVLIRESFGPLYEYKESKICKYLTIAIFSIGVMTLTEYYAFQFLIPFFAISYNIKFLIKNEK